MLMIREDSYHVEHIMSQAELVQFRNRSSPLKHYLPHLLLLTICIFYGLSIELMCAACIFLAMVFIISKIWHKFHDLVMKRNLKKLRQLLFLQNEVIQQMKKSLCLLRARSPTATDRTISSRGSILHSSCIDKSAFVEEFSTIPMLRNCLLETVLNMTKYMHSVTKNMIETVPLLSQADPIQGYLCSSDWCDLELQDIFPNCDENVSIQYLQRLTSFYIIIQSEFLRRLSLSFCPKMWPKFTNKLSNLIWDTVENVSWEMTRNSFKLVKNYWLYCGYEKWRNMGTKENKPKINLGLNGDLFQAFQEWFLSVQEVSNGVSFCLKQIEPKNSIVNNDKNCESHLYEVMEEAMVELELLLKKSNSYFEICFKKLKKSCNNLGVEEKFPSYSSLKANEYDCSEFIPVEHNDFDLEVEDEVFEDVVHGNLPTKDEEFDFEINIEETKNKIRMKHFAMFFLELKEALSYRAEKVKEREAKALQKKKCQISGCSNSPLLSDSANHENCGSGCRRENTMFSELEELYAIKPVMCNVEESHSDIAKKLTDIGKNVGCIKVNPESDCSITGSQEIDESEEHCEKINSDFETLQVELSSPRLGKTSGDTKFGNVHNDKLCGVNYSSLCEANLVFGDGSEEDKEADDVSGEKITVLQSSLLSELAVRAAQVASTAQHMRISPMFPFDSVGRNVCQESVLDFSQNNIQLIEESFSYDPDEENK
ncbi:uncharacterized protein LOC134529504 isoform X2 [Bacillus rossius redtenbacheri]